MKHASLETLHMNIEKSMLAATATVHWKKRRGKIATFMKWCAHSVAKLTVWSILTAGRVYAYAPRAKQRASSQMALLLRPLAPLTRAVNQLLSPKYYCSMVPPSNQQAGQRSPRPPDVCPTAGFYSRKQPLEQ
ncbi:hypothetical protein HPB47_000003 [Ixodes persulcatus]|uniref:Uncharacterized protein n=1 Tax=Ixodes persulcatus TaxID=34615 RepID=A0AC60PSY8_IXOPE|nr:hypothetical protein HPB47_000003 [Ixodes persulcatus]